MTTGQNNYAPSCPVRGKHDLLPHLHVAFPWIEQTSDVPKAITAFTLDCDPCMEHHRYLAGQHPSLAHRALWLWLVTVSMARVNMGLPPVSTAADMMDGFPGTPSARQRAADPTWGVLESIPLGEAATSEGEQANIWQREDVERVIAVLRPEQRELVWTGLIMALSGWYQGTARAHTEMQEGTA